MSQKNLDLSVEMHLRETQRGVKSLKKIFKNNDNTDNDNGVNNYDSNNSDNDNEIDDDNDIDGEYTSSSYSPACFSECALKSDEEVGPSNVTTIIKKSSYFCPTGHDRSVNTFT